MPGVGVGGQGRILLDGWGWRHLGAGCSPDVRSAVTTGVKSSQNKCYKPRRGCQISQGFYIQDKERSEVDGTNYITRQAVICS